MMTAIAVVLVFVGGLVLGVMSLLGYMIWRLMRNAEWDDSNITNALRLLSHVVLHPGDFGRMYYLSDRALQTLFEAREMAAINFHRPFWYINKDELSEVVKTRP